ncbi:MULTISPECIES: S8 family serine peptidase [unclassified Ketobacter]|uniref:S8 family serine peptidase n=1 Tax=unclassified Ketobacter TaxID=2639109 RepID=UPI0025BF473E|nr:MULTISPECIES: S8 family serine peptidase [unclassified Ketobacter]MCK5791269.1 S8 family peptidase [Ketobacter sp.]MEC8811335.1 S8 family serine peptidase [Pseudomonadota bacterium]
MLFGVSVMGAGVSVAAGDLQSATDRLIVKFKTPLSQAERASPRALQRLQTLGVSGIVGRPMANGAYVVTMSESRQRQAWLDVMNQLSFDPDVAYVEPDLLMVPTADPYYDFQWYLQSPLFGINADNAWNFSTGSGAVIAVLDTGILAHPDLIANTLAGYDFVSDLFMANDGNGRDNNPLDPGDGVTAGACGGGQPQQDRYSSWHGSHVAGIAAAPVNGIGVTGVAYDAGILPLRVMGRCGGYTSDIVDAIYWASGYNVADVPPNPTPADVVNLSLSSTVTGACGPSYSEAINAAVGAGVMVVTSAGNSNANANDYAPGNCDGVINVAATDRYGDKAPYSNTGSVVDLAAPGGRLVAGDDLSGIWSTLNSGQFEPAVNNYQPYQGTSMAAPQVAATIALMRSAVPDATPAELAAALVDTTQNFIGNCAGCGSGLLDSEEAVKRIMGLTVPSAVSDLRVTLQGDNGKYIEDGDGTGTIQYKVVITNDGPDQAEDLVASHVFPAQVTLESLAPPPGVICNVTDYTCRWSEQLAGESLTFTIRVRTANENKMDFSAGVDSADTDPDNSNNYVTKKFGGGIGVLGLLFAFALLRRRG